MQRRRGAVGVVVAMVAVLLPAAVVAATTVDGRTTSAGPQVGTAALGLEGIPDERPTLPSTTITVVAPTTAPLPTTTTAPRRTTTTSTPSATGSTTTTLLVGIPPTRPTTTTVPHVPPVSSWSADNRGLRVQMHLEPAEPVAGEPVDFVVELTPVDGCCIVYLTFGDGSAIPLGVDAACTRTADTVRAVTRHTYAAPGAYRALLVVATVPCGGLAFPPTGLEPAAPGAIYGANINACVVIGPTTAPKAACAP